MDLIDLTKRIIDIAHRIDLEKAELSKLAQNKAESEKVYRIALAKAIFTLKDDKMQATLIPDLARGLVAELKFNRDLADSLYYANRDSMGASLAQLNAFQSLLKIQRDIET